MVNVHIPEIHVVARVLLDAVDVGPPQVGVRVVVHRDDGLLLQQDVLGVVELFKPLGVVGGDGRLGAQAVVIEIDPAGVAQRELGFNERGEVIVAGPMGKNFGFFTDSNATFAPADYPAVSA